MGRVAVNAAAAIAAAKTAKKAVQSGVNWKRKMIAQEELDAGKDLDGDGVVGGVGNRARQRDRLRRQELERRAERKRKDMDQAG
jgi:hypothetical protein